MKNPVTRRRIVILGALTFSSFLLRFFTAIREVVYPDSCYYLSFARSILNGKFSSNFYGGVDEILPPLYSLYSALFSLFIGNVELSGILVSAIAGALLIIPVFYLAKAVFNEKAAWISSVLVFLSPVLIHWSRAILTESLFITLFISGIAMGVYAIERRKWISLFISGALIGLSYMTRVIGLIAIPVLGLWVIFLREGEGGGVIAFGKICRKVFTSLTIFSLGFILITGLYLIRLHSFYGHWTLAGSYGSIKGTIAYEGASTPAGWEKLQTEFSEEGPYGKLIKKITINAGNYSTSLLWILSITTIFVLTGLFYRWKVLYIVSFIMAYFGSLLVQPLSPMADERIRYLSPILPLFIVIASGGIGRIHDWIRSQEIRKASIPVMIIIVLLSSIPQLKMFPLRFNRFWEKENSVNIKEKVGLWMKNNLPHPIRIMSRKPYIPYYADAIFFTTPATYDEVIKLANEKGVDYIAIDRGIDFYLRPNLRFLFDPGEAPEDLKLIGGLRHPETGELYIGLYKIKRTP